MDIQHLIEQIDMICIQLNTHNSIYVPDTDSHTCMYTHMAYVHEYTYTSMHAYTKNKQQQNMAIYVRQQIVSAIYEFMFVPKCVCKTQHYYKERNN